MIYIQMLVAFDILFCIVGLYGLLIFYNIFFYLYFKKLKKKSYKIIKWYYEVDVNMFYIYIVLSLGISLFIYRLGKTNYSFNIYHFWDQLKVYWSMVELIDIIIVTIGLLLVLILGLNIIRYFLERLKSSILTVHLYYLQFKPYLNFCNSCIMFKVNLEMFTYRTLKKVISQELANRYSPIIENFIINLEKIWFRYIIIYLYIFDGYCQFGKISKVFIILPWYFLYAMLRVLINYYWNLITDLENDDLSQEFYHENKQKNQSKLLVFILILSYFFIMLYIAIFLLHLSVYFMVYYIKLIVITLIMFLFLLKISFWGVDILKKHKISNKIILKFEAFKKFITQKIDQIWFNVFSLLAQRSIKFNFFMLFLSKKLKQHFEKFVSIFFLLDIFPKIIIISVILGDIFMAKFNYIYYNLIFLLLPLILMTLMKLLETFSKENHNAINSAVIFKKENGISKYHYSNNFIQPSYIKNLDDFLDNYLMPVNQISEILSFYNTLREDYKITWINNFIWSLVILFLII